MSEPTLLLVDGSSYLYRAFHALPDLRTRAGEPTGAIRGVVSMLRNLRANRKLAGDVRYGAVVFDAPGRTFRDDLYDAYKANRAETPADLRTQIAPIHEMVRAMGWPLLHVEGVEADDVIGTLTEQAWRRGIRTLVATGDKDLAQLVNGHVTLVDTMTRKGEAPEPMDREGVIAKFGVPPERIVDWLTLVGDAVDNVPGVPKVGPKTAVKWLEEHGTLDGVIAAADRIGGVVGENLRGALGWLPTARALVTIKTDCELAPHVGSIESSLEMRDEDGEALRALFERWEMKSLVDDLRGRGDAGPQAPAPVAGAGADPAAPAAPASAPPAPAHPVEYECVSDEATLERWIAEIEAASLVAFDTETTSLDPLAAEIVGLSLAVQPYRACYVPLAHRYAGAPDQLDRDRVLARLRGWLESPERRKVGQNLKYDAHVLANHGIALRGIEHDTLLQSYVLEAHRTHGMDALAERHLGRRTITYEEVAGKGAKQIGFEEVPIERATEYAAEDAEVTMHLHTVLFPRVAADAKLHDVYRRIEMPTSIVLQRMERHGVLIDAPLLERQSEALGAKMMELERAAHEAAGQPFNLGSPKQLGEILFGTLKLPVLKKTMSGAPSTDEDVLAKLAEDYPLPKILLEYRGCSKLKSTYTDKLPKMVNPRTGRVHTSFSQATAVTGRLSSNEPNLQNIPIRTAEGRRIREAFVAPPGHLIVSADYSQIELRIMAHLSQDGNLLRAFHEGMDVHRATASEVFGVPPAEVSSEQRRYAKTINFGLIYGMSAFGLAAQLGIEREAAKNWIERYFARYPGVKRYMDGTRTQAKAQGWVETVLGRRLWLPEINSPNGPRRGGAERQAINAPLQGTAADIVKLAMIAVQDWLDAGKFASRLVLQVHDELVLEVPEGELETIRIELPRLMAGVVALDVPLLAEVGAGPNWERAH
ncbi:MAG: DNA polymerase I [Burkholderiaceae bacterium]|nr:DNA polymerase I [Burkholderiales bacterium]MCZ8339835.1 DNA polymerase I [Burkholderiaceae bacterium]